MKKKTILFVFMMLLTASLFLTFASAATTNAFGTAETSNKINLDGMATDDDVYCVLFDGTEYHTYPSRYIVTNANNFTYNFDKINEAFGKSYKKDSVIRIEIPAHVTALNDTNCFAYGNNNNVKEIIFPDDTQCTTLGWGAFENNKSLERIVMPKTLTTVGNNLFCSCSALKELIFPEDSVIEEIAGDKFISSCTSIEKIQFPNSLKRIGTNSIGVCSKLKEVRFGASIEVVKGAWSDMASSSTFYIPASFYSSTVTEEPPSNLFHWAGTQGNGTDGNTNNPKNLTFVFTGTEAEAKALQARFKAADESRAFTGLKRLYEATLCTEAEYETLTGKKIGEGSTNGNYLVYGYNNCKAFYGNEHDYKGTGSCIDGAYCDRCPLTIEGAENHNFVESINYENGYTSVGTYSYVCTNDACVNFDVVEERNPIFSALAENGFSTNKNGIAFGGYTVDLGTLSEFNNINKKSSLKYGVVIINPKYVGDTFFDGTEINSSQGFIKADMTDSRFSNISVMIDGFTGEALDLELVIALYAYTDGKNIQFIQSQDTNSACSKVTKSDATLYTVSLYSVKNKPNSSIEALPEFGKKSKE